MIFSETKQIAVSPKAVTPMFRTEHLDLFRITLKTAATINGKKNNPAKSLNLPVNQDGLIIFKTWSLNNSIAILARDNGCCKQFRLF